MNFVSSDITQDVKLVRDSTRKTVECLKHNESLSHETKINARF
jgi:hypothetical protein